VLWDRVVYHLQPILKGYFDVMYSVFCALGVIYHLQPILKGYINVIYSVF
jgi:hypothetical protein